jgi:hypothetical protein
VWLDHDLRPSGPEGRLHVTTAWAPQKLLATGGLLRYLSTMTSVTTISADAGPM